MRLAKEIKPTFIFLENVAAIRAKGLNRVGQELARAGYDCRWDFVSAREVGAPHIRKRWFCLAHTRGELRQQISDGPFGNEEKNERRGQEKNNFIESNGQIPVVNASSEGLERWIEPAKAWSAQRQCGSDSAQYRIHGLPEPAICRGSDGIPNRVDRIKSLGNAVVPLQAKKAFERLMGLMALDSYKVEEKQNG
jgi:DNA (cytosine-5)-methyltransferase 1